MVINNQDILEKAIQKAIDGGWNDPFVFRLQGWVTNALEVEPGLWMPIIFNHDFAKALWGDNLVDWVSGQEVVINARGQQVLTPRWKLHLQDMVIAPDPIKYLGENL